MNLTTTAPCKTILVVEDDADIREVLREVLEVEGFTVRTADNGKVGLETLEEIGRPCLILLDLMMPVMNGLEFLAALRARSTPRSPPVVIVSAYSDIAREVSGAAGRLSKPIDLDDLFGFVHHHCCGSA